MAAGEVTQKMILDYMCAKGGVVRNTDLVRHFKKYLQLSDKASKGACPYYRPGAACVSSAIISGGLLCFRDEAGPELKKNTRGWLAGRAAALEGSSVHKLLAAEAVFRFCF